MLFAHRVGGEMKKVLLSIISIFFCLGALVGGGLLLTGCDSPSSQTQLLEPGGDLTNRKMIMTPKTMIQLSICLMMKIVGMRRAKTAL